jgi:CBS domain-containing protein
MPKIVPDIVSDQTITSVTPEVTVRQAARLMAERNIAAVLVTQPDGRTLAGIMTERDIAARVVARSLDAGTVTVGEVMTKSPDTLLPTDRPMQALTMMREHGYRHIPVCQEDGTVVAMVSVRDLYAFVQGELEHDLKERDHYIFGEAYGQVNA